MSKLLTKFSIIGAVILFSLLLLLPASNSVAASSKKIGRAHV